MNKNSKNKVIIFGAGFSKHLGIPTTVEIDSIVTTLLQKEKTIEQRLRELQKDYPNIFDDVAVEDFRRTLIILLDDDCKTEGEARNQREKEIERYTDLYAAHYPQGKKVFHHRLKEEILVEIDWLALKSIYQAYGFKNIIDLLTILTKAMTEGVSIPTVDIFRKGNLEKIYYNNPSRINSALIAYKYMVFKIFKHSFRINRQKIKDNKSIYYEFFEDIFQYAYSNLEHNSDLSKLGLVSFNWDMVLLFLSMKTNSMFNRRERMKGTFYYTDLGYPFPRVKLNYDANKYDYLISRETATILKKLKQKNLYTLYTNIIRLFLPHGSVNLRICKRCFTPFFYFTGSVDDMELEDLSRKFLVDPLPNTVDIYESKQIIGIKKAYEKGEPDAVLCPHCNHHTHFTDTYMEIQSIFKEKPSNIMEKIYYEYGYFYGQADSVVAIGYSFPKDDIYALYHLIFGSLNHGELIKKGISMINFHSHFKEKKWYKDLDCLYDSFRDRKEEGYINMIDSLKKLLEINSSRVRINFSGFPYFYQNKEISIKEMLEF